MRSTNNGYCQRPSGSDNLNQTILINNRMKAYVLFGNDDVDDAADDRNKVEYVPRITEVILFRQSTTVRQCRLMFVRLSDRYS